MKIKLDAPMIIPIIIVILFSLYPLISFNRYYYFSKKHSNLKNLKLKIKSFRPFLLYIYIYTSTKLT